MDIRTVPVDVKQGIKGKVELWDAWTGKTQPLTAVKRTETGTQVQLPLDDYEAQVVVFTPGKKH